MILHVILLLLDSHLLKCYNYAKRGGALEMYKMLLKPISLLIAAAMLLPTVSCSNKKSDDIFSDIKLSESEQSWSNKNEKYSELLETYG